MLEKLIKCIVLTLAIASTLAVYLIKDDERSWKDSSGYLLWGTASLSWAIYFTYLL
jgi:hypothetical protein